MSVPDQAGLFFDDGETALVKADALAVNEPRTLKAIVPAILVVGKDYTLKIVTQSPARHGATGFSKTCGKYGQSSNWPLMPRRAGARVCGGLALGAAEA